MKTYYLNDHTITFDESHHQYYLDGIKIASISQITNAFFTNNQIKKVDAKILEEAALKGNLLKEKIHAYENDKIKTFDAEMQSYIALKNQHQFEMIDYNPLVLLRHQGTIIAAGRFDMVVQSPYMKGMGLVSIKRTSHLRMDYLTFQLNLYKLAYEQSYKTKINYLKCIHIRNRHQDYLDIVLDQNKTKLMLDDYLAKNPLDYRLYL
ncbi:MAG: hypothetical protein ACLFRI_03455 [Candidatus Izemoplasmataceae bacterium]